jgi:hypothetical protein
MAIDNSTQVTDTSGGDGEPRPPSAGDGKKGNTAELAVVAAKLKEFLREVPPDYLSLSITPAPSAKAYRRRKLPAEVSLANVDAPAGYLSLSITPLDQPQLGGGGDSVVTDASSAASRGGEKQALVVVEAVVLPPPPVQQIAEKCLPPKKRRLAAAGVHQETAGTVLPSSSPCLALANVNDHGGTLQSSMPTGVGGDGETRSPAATMASDPIDAVPLQAVYVHGGVSHPFRLGSSAGDITTNETAGGQAKKVP